MRAAGGVPSTRNAAERARGSLKPSLTADADARVAAAGERAARDAHAAGVGALVHAGPRATRRRASSRPWRRARRGRDRSPSSAPPAHGARAARAGARAPARAARPSARGAGARGRRARVRRRRRPRGPARRSSRRGCPRARSAGAARRRPRRARAPCASNERTRTGDVGRRGDGAVDPLRGGTTRSIWPPPGPTTPTANALGRATAMEAFADACAALLRQLRSALSTCAQLRGEIQWFASKVLAAGPCSSS